MSIIKKNTDRNAAIVVAAGRGLGDVANSCATTKQLMDAVYATDVSFGNEDFGQSLRVRLRSQPINTKIPIAVVDSEYIGFIDKQFTAPKPDARWDPESLYPPIFKANIFGYARRNLMQWGEKLVVCSARTTFELGGIKTGEEQRSAMARGLHNQSRSIIQLSKNFKNPLDHDGFYLSPRVQSRLMGRIDHEHQTHKHFRLSLIHI